MRWLRWLFVVLLVVAAAPKHASAQDDVITGNLVGPDKKPIVGARVEVVSMETEIVRSGLSDAKGRYFILFPDGGGRYILRITYLGMADIVKQIQRSGDEEMIYNNYTMTEGAVTLAAITATTTRAVNEQNAGKTAEQSTNLTQEQLNRLPLPDLDAATIALLTAGVTGTGADSVSGKLGFSVAGMSDVLNQVVIDGVVQGSGGGTTPEEGIRRTTVTTSTFDASKGGFAGGQVTQSSARGNNRKAGSFSYRLDADALQVNAGATTNAFTKNNFGGSWGGPLKLNKLFYNTSFQLTREVDHRFALEADDPLAAIRAGVAVDSINRFVAIASNQLGTPIIGQTGPYNQFVDQLALQGRIDWNINQSRTNSSTLSLRGNYSNNNQDSTRISTLDISDHGGESARHNYSIGSTWSARFASNFTNNLNGSFSENKSNSVGYSTLPEGRVRVTSQFEDGTAQTSTLSFGGNRSFPTDAYSRDLQLTDDLSFLLHVGTQVHRLKVGGNVQNTRNIDRSSNNIFGSYTFNSLADFEANNPASFTRSLSPRKTNTGTYNAGMYVGDTWRISEPLELTMGLRYDLTSLDVKPAFNPDVLAVFNRHTDVSPTAWGMSPRIGFNYRIGGSTNNFNQQAKNLSGGVGLFAGRAPTNIFSTALRQTGLPNADVTISCIGTAIPTPDWTQFGDDPSSIPATCADGGVGNPTQSFRAPDVTLIDPKQKLPSSARVNLGYRTQLPGQVQANIGYSYSYGMGLWGYRDLNLNEANPTILGNEGREFFGDPNAIVPTTGAVLFASSRLHPQYGGVYDVYSDLHSSSHQATVSLQGFLFNRKLTLGTNYTLGFSRDQASGSFSQATTAGDPNKTEWGTSSQDVRHTLNLQAAYAFSPFFEFSLNGRVSSGSPFTPLVNSDVNGDGARNDRAYVFDPTTIADTSIANGMNRLLTNAPGRVVSCIESQFNQIADRNSCRNSWTEALSFRGSIRPNLPTLQRRMTISVDGSNVLTGLDQLINGSNNMHGWGSGQRGDANLLEVRGFDPVSKSFIYQVNEGFGQTRRGPNSLRQSFSLTLSARVLIGGQPQQTNRGFGQIGGGFGGGFGGGGGGGGRGGPGGGGGFGGGGRGGQGGFGGFDLGALTTNPAKVNIDSMLQAQLKNPIATMIVLKDSLKLTPENVAALQPISDSLQIKLNRRIDNMKPVAEEIIGSAIANRATGGQGVQNQNTQTQMQQQLQTGIQPEITSGHNEINQALTAAAAAVGPTVWARIPQNLKQQQNQGGGGRGGAFNAVGLLDRQLVNPIPVIVSMKDTLKLTPEQLTQIDAISAPITDLMLKTRTDLGKKFDNVQPQQMGQIFGEIQPTIDAARKQAQAALKAVQKVLTSAQWKMLPDRVKDPFTNAGGPGGGGPGGGRGPGGGGL